MNIQIFLKFYFILFLVLADFIYKHIKSQIENLDIAMLVNNVGVAYKLEFFHKLENQDSLIDNLIQVNTKSVAKMTAIVLPGYFYLNESK